MIKSRIENEYVFAALGVKNNPKDSRFIEEHMFAYLGDFNNQDKTISIRDPTM